VKKVFDFLPNWSFDLDEVSAGVYQVIATHVKGCSLEIKGTEPDALMERAVSDAKKIQSDLEHFAQSRSPSSNRGLKSTELLK
jgi:hypothetical protein